MGVLEKICSQIKPIRFGKYLNDANCFELKVDMKKIIIATLLSFCFSFAVSAQSKLLINEPSVVKEIETVFAQYDTALGSNDISALNAYFWDDPLTIRFGNSENLYGLAEIKAYRSSQAVGTPRIREKVVIVTYGNNFATVSARNQAFGGKIGRTMQTWVKFPEGWKIVAAHVSTMNELVKE